MQSLKKFYPLHSWLLSSLLILSACTPQQFSPVSSVHSALQTEHDGKISAKQTLSKRVHLEINTGLWGKDSSSHIIDLSQILLMSQNFKIQSDSSPIFSETFIQTKGLLEEIHEFKIADPNKRYTLKINKQGSEKDKKGHLEINLNGIDWIKPQDQNKDQEEISIEGLLLNANNMLRIRSSGKIGSKITLSLFEGGEVGTLLKRSKNLHDLEETQATRIRQNDTNIFDPNDPNSLGGLKPYEGEQTSLYGQQIGLAKLNGDSIAKIISGQLLVTLQEPVADNLQTILDSFPVKEVRREVFAGNTTVRFEIDYSRVSLTSFLDNIYLLNQRDGIDALQEAQFSSLNTAKTIAVAMDIQAHAQNIYGISLDFLGDKEGAVDTQEENDPNLPISRSPDTFITELNKTPLPQAPVKASDLWWLNAINAREAWQYTMGENTTVAIIDSNFGLIQDNPDFYQSGKTRVDIGGNDKSRNYLHTIAKGFNFNDQDLRSDSSLQNIPGHGLAVAQVLAASANDHSGIAGVAPQVKLIPMYSTGGIESEVGDQLKRIDRENIPVDVVNISMGRFANFLDQYFPAIDAYFDLWILRTGFKREKVPHLSVATLEMLEVIERLRKKNMIVVVAAGNRNRQILSFGEDTKFDPQNQNKMIQQIAIPASFPNVIPVGGYEYKTGSTIPMRTDMNLINDLDAIGSNYGWEIYLWAPAEGIWVKTQEYDNATKNYEGKWEIREGTSFATPMVAGTVALMKSLNKNLSFAEVVQILYAHGKTLTDPSFANQTNFAELNFALDTGKSVSDSRVLNQNRSGLKAFFFQGISASGTPLQNVPSVFSQLNFVGGEIRFGDPFGIGLIDNFSARFEGFIKLPQGYSPGTYRIIVGHDDGASLYLNNQNVINAYGYYDYTEHAVDINFTTSEAKELLLYYFEGGGESELGLFWITPEGRREVIPSSALSHL